ncbi:UNKNOWN [Stylonychia lemnae]|uniref:Uncharacterized protein n=1 Tax=Stylonychia lemnae TaxID=5949 RepID=A0A078B7T1_STYLE|nr:UNKNOWN [Stylonychia lemnae]|eukprot:CDW90575.1 UNKNOWN [Stylonychia lemnae]
MKNVAVTPVNAFFPAISILACYQHHSFIQLLQCLQSLQNHQGQMTYFEVNDEIMWLFHFTAYLIRVETQKYFSIKSGIQQLSLSITQWAQHSPAIKNQQITRYVSAVILTFSLVAVMWFHYKEFFWYYHYWAFLLNFLCFILLAVASSLSSVSSIDLYVKIVYQVTLSVTYTAVPFYIGWIYNDELFSYDMKKIMIPVLVNAVPFMLITFEFLMNAIQFSTTYWYIPTSLCFLYIMVDFIRTRITKVNLVSTLTWTGNESIIFATLLVILQYFIFLVFSKVSSGKSINGASRFT